MRSSPRRRNILFITADQWRGDCLSANGHPVVRTPNLDALAADGVRFNQHYTNAVPCSPSRTSLHTGLYQLTHRVVLNGTPLDGRFTNWAIELRNAGRDPVLVGYTDTTLDPKTLAPDDERRKSTEECLPGLRQLADCNMENKHMEDWAQFLRGHGYPVPEEYQQLRLEKAEGKEYGEGGTVPLPLKLPAELSETVFLVDRTIQHIRGCGEREWSVHLSLFRPHPPHIAPAPYNAMYDPSALPPHKRMPTRADETASHPFIRWATEWYSAPEEEEQRRQQASYYGLMSEVDAELGRLFAWLKEQDQWEETLIVFTSDHGEQMGDHWLKAKTCARASIATPPHARIPSRTHESCDRDTLASLPALTSHVISTRLLCRGFFDQSYHIPLIVRDPQAASTRGLAISGFTESVDIAPTLLDFAGVACPAQFDGFSLLPAAKRGCLPDGWRAEAFWEYVFWHDTFVVTDEDYEKRLASELGIAPHQCALCVLRSDRFKYVHFAAKLRPLLFDLCNDPDELHDVSLDPRYAPAMAAMSSQMLTRRLSHADRAHTEVVVTSSGPESRRMPLPLPAPERPKKYILFSTRASPLPRLELR